MKFSKMVKGKLAEEPINIPGYEVNGEPAKTLLVPLTGMDLLAAFEKAREIAKARGSVDPKEGDPVYDLALQAAIVAKACLDPDSDPNDRKPTFSGPEELLQEDSPEMTVYLHEMQVNHQVDCSPNVYKLSGAGEGELYELVSEVAGAVGRQLFMRLSPNMRLNLSIFMAKKLVELWPSPNLKSSGGSGSESNETSDESEPPTSEQEPKKNESNENEKSKSSDSSTSSQGDS